MGGVVRSEPLVLVVDDEATVRQALERALRLEGFAVATAADGIEALAAVAQKPPAVIVLDVTMPRLDGVSVVKRLRSDGIDTPVCMLSARDEVDDRVAGLQAGADDYLVKPFATEELIARIRALTRRGAPATESLRFADLTLDLPTRTAARGGRTVELSGRETALLELLLRDPRSVLTRERALERVWDDAAVPNVVDRYVGRLRRKLGEPPLIHTVRGVGFMLRS